MGDGLMLARNYLIYEDVSTKDFNIWISGEGIFDAPERNLEFVAVPGRNGSLTVDKGSFKNIKLEYPAFIPQEFKRNMESFRAKIRALTGYHKLEDTYTPDYYRMAALVDDFKPVPSQLYVAGEFRIVFNCKPQRFLKTGDEWQTVTSGTALLNPTPYTAKPLLRVWGTGTFYVGSVPVQITSTTDYTDIDCELQDAYRGLTNRNGYVKLLNGVFPTLPAGSTGITFSNTITRFDVMPKWWTI